METPVAGHQGLAAKFGIQFLLLLPSLFMVLGTERGSLCPLDKHSVTELQGLL